MAKIINFPKKPTPLSKLSEESWKELENSFDEWYKAGERHQRIAFGFFLTGFILLSISLISIYYYSIRG